MLSASSTIAGRPLRGFRVLGTIRSTAIRTAGSATLSRSRMIVARSSAPRVPKCLGRSAIEDLQQLLGGWTVMVPFARQSHPDRDQEGNDPQQMGPLLLRESLQLLSHGRVLARSR